MSKIFRFVCLVAAYLLALSTIAVGALFMWITVYLGEGDGLMNVRLYLAAATVILGLVGCAITAALPAPPRQTEK